MSTREDKTDVLKILCDVRGLGSAGEWWLHSFIEACDDENVAKLQLRIATMPKSDVLLATLASLTKWERNKLNKKRDWTLGCTALTCPLCKTFVRNPGNGYSCEGCPLAFFGGPCERDGGPDERDDAPSSPYQLAVWENEPLPLIEALRKAVDRVVNEKGGGDGD